LLIRRDFSAAAFFTAYENLKQNLPKQSSFFNANPAVTHMLAASGGEFVSGYITQTQTDLLTAPIVRWLV